MLTDEYIPITRFYFRAITLGDVDFCLPFDLGVKCKQITFEQTDTIKLEVTIKGEDVIHDVSQYAIININKGC